MSIRHVVVVVAAGVAVITGAYVVGKDQGTPKVDPTLPHIVRAGNVFQTHCPEDLWPVPMQTPRPKDHNYYDVAPPAFACVPRKAVPRSRKVWADDRKSYYVEDYCPESYREVPFFGSGGGGGAFSCGRSEWVAALEEQMKR